MNRFEAVHAAADETKCRKQEYYDKELSYTWERDDAYLDIDDLIDGSKRALAIGYKVFKTLRSNPHTKMIDIPMGQRMPGMDVPQTALMNLLQAALSKSHQTMTDRQKEAMQAHDEAIELGVTATTYVAQKLGINRHSAYKLIKRAKMETFPENVAYVYSSVHRNDAWSPTPKQVTAMMKSKPRICAYCGGTTYDGSVPLCFTCHSKLGSLRQEAWDKRTRSWLPDEINRIRREHHAWAVDQCFKAHYGTVSIEEYEFLMDAA